MHFALSFINDLPSDGCGNFLPPKINFNSFFYLVPPRTPPPPLQEVHLCHVTESIQTAVLVD